MASDGTAFDAFGRSVAISGDTVVVGTWTADVGANADQGAAYVFVKPGTGWADLTQTAKLTASDGAANGLFGASVAINGDTVVVGATGGASAYVFVKPAGGWVDMTETARLTAADGEYDDLFGGSVAINGDTVVVGAHNDDLGGRLYDQGWAYIFVKPDTGRADMTQTAKRPLIRALSVDVPWLSMMIVPCAMRCK